MCYRFLFGKGSEKRQIPYEDKILNPQLAVAPSLRYHRWLSSCRRLSRGGPPRALRRAICQYSQRHSCIVHPRAQLFGVAISALRRCSVKLSSRVALHRAICQYSKRLFTHARSCSALPSPPWTGEAARSPKFADICQHKIHLWPTQDVADTRCVGDDIPAR